MGLLVFPCVYTELLICVMVKLLTPLFTVTYIVTGYSELIEPNKVPFTKTLSSLEEHVNVISLGSANVSVFENKGGMVCFFANLG